MICLYNGCGCGGCADRGCNTECYGYRNYACGGKHYCKEGSKGSELLALLHLDHKEYDYYRLNSYENRENHDKPGEVDLLVGYNNVYRVKLVGLEDYVITVNGGLEYVVYSVTLCHYADTSEILYLSGGTHHNGVEAVIVLKESRVAEVKLERECNGLAVYRYVSLIVGHYTLNVKLLGKLLVICVYNRYGYVKSTVHAVVVGDGCPESALVLVSVGIRGIGSTCNYDGDLNACKVCKSRRLGCLDLGYGVAVLNVEIVESYGCRVKLGIKLLDLILGVLSATLLCDSVRTDSRDSCRACLLEVNCDLSLVLYVVDRIHSSGIIRVYVFYIIIFIYDLSNICKILIDDRVNCRASVSHCLDLCLCLCLSCKEIALAISDLKLSVEESEMLSLLCYVCTVEVAHICGILVYSLDIFIDYRLENIIGAVLECLKSCYCLDALIVYRYACKSKVVSVLGLSAISILNIRY